MKEFFAGMAFTLILEGVAAVVVVTGKIKEAIEGNYSVPQTIPHSRIRNSRK